MRLLALLLLAVTAAGVTAQPGAPPVGQLVTEEEFLAPFVDGSPATVALAEALEARRADLAAARLLDDPIVAIEREDVERQGAETGVSLSWQPPRPDRRRLALEAARAEVAAADAALVSSRELLRLDLRAAFAGWAVAAARLEPVEQELEVVRELTRRAGRRAEAGEGSGLDHRRLLLVSIETEARVASARADLALAEAEARAWRPDLPAASEPVLPPLPPAAPPAADDRAHPRIAALEAELRAAELEAALAGKVGSLPALAAGWKWIEATGAAEPAGGTHGGPTVGLSWTVPVFDRGAPERLRARARVDALEARRTLLLRRLQAERSGLDAAYAVLRNAVRDAEESLATAEPAVEAAQLAFRLGEIDLTTLLETIRNATAAKLAAVETHRHALDAVREIERVRGATEPTRGDSR